jgi:uncharacterized protein (TIGR03086 family)
MIDFEPVTSAVAGVVRGVRDDQLTAKTPCPESSLGDLLDHLDGLALAFTAAATKTVLPPDQQAPRPDAARLGTDWRERIPRRLDELAAAWRDASAWDGMTRAGGQDLPGEIAGRVALDEVLVHGWDIAVAAGQRFNCAPDHVTAAMEFVEPTAKQNPDGVPGLFGPVVPVPGDAPPLHRLLGLTGRDPKWQSVS